MTKTVGENICESSNTTGTSPYELAGSVLGYRSFADAGFVTGDKPRYVVRNRQNSKYEFNRGEDGSLFTDSSPDTLDRGTYLSSNSNAPVSWTVDDVPLTIYIPDELEVVRAEATSEAEVSWNSTGNGADEKRWRAYVDADGVLVFDATEDDGTTHHDVLSVARDGSMAPVKVSSSEVNVQGTSPVLRVGKTDNATDEKNWKGTVDGSGDLILKAVNDAESSGAEVKLVRDGTIEATTPTDPDEDSATVPTTEWVNAAIATALAGVGSSFETGDVLFSTRGTKAAGWLKMDDGTIGDASSGGTTRANADTQDLFTHLYDTFSNSICPVSGGRGASAAADFAAHKTIGLTKVCGRALIAAGSGSGLTARSPGDSLGEQTHTLTSAEQASMNLNAGTIGSVGPLGAGSTLVDGTGSGSIGTTPGSSAGASQATGGGGSHNNMQPSYAMNVWIHL